MLKIKITLFSRFKLKKSTIYAIIMKHKKLNMLKSVTIELIKYETPNNIYNLGTN